MNQHKYYNTIMEKLKWYEKIQAVSAHRYAHRREFNQKIEKIKYGNEGKKRTTTSKAVLYFIFINLTIVELYSMFLIWYTGETSSLGILISSVVGEGFAYAVYSAKALKENVAKYGNTQIYDNDSQG